MSGGWGAERRSTCINIIVLIMNIVIIVVIVALLVCWFGCPLVCVFVVLVVCWCVCLSACLCGTVCVFVCRCVRLCADVRPIGSMRASCVTICQKQIENVEWNVIGACVWASAPGKYREIMTRM